MSLFLFQLYNELKKLFARKRSYIGFGAFFTMECVVLFLFNRPGPRAHFKHVIEQNGYGFNQ
jgi:ABC-2 type transport system permease protein